jgi:hypothetical protein
MWDNSAFIRDVPCRCYCQDVTRDHVAGRFNHVHDCQYPAAAVIIMSILKTNIPSRLIVRNNCISSGE